MSKSWSSDPFTLVTFKASAAALAITEAAFVAALPITSNALS